MKENHYRHLGMMAALSFVAMYILMYAMVNTVDDVYMNVNQVYMAGVMTAPMVVIELVVISIQDREITELCKGIVAGQQAEINQMRAKLRQLQ